jgi:hypothetical protein
MISLTFDSDWISNSQLETLALHETIPGSGTFFCTEHYEYFDKHKEMFEVSIHPTFDDFSKMHDLISDMRNAINPECTGFRAHSLAYTQMLGIYLNKNGFNYVSQATYLNKTGLTPYRHPWGIWEFPIYYMDSMDVTFSENWPDFFYKPFNPDIIDNAVKADDNELFVFDFHPIHLLLNTPDRMYYAKMKAKGAENLDESDAYPHYGIRDFYVDLVKAMKNKGIESKSLIEIFKRLKN